MDIETRLENWNQLEEWRKVIEALDKKSLEPYKYPPDEALTLALAYVSVPSKNWEEEKANNLKALDLLRPLKEKFYRDLAWNYLWGIAHFNLEHYLQARSYLENSLNFNPSKKMESRIRGLLERTYVYSSMPLFHQPFKDRVKSFWKNFLKEEPALWKAYKNQKGNSLSALETLWERLLRDLFSLESICAVKQESDKLEVTLRHCSDVVQCFEWQYLKKMAPSEVLKHWTIHLGIPPYQEGQVIPHNILVAMDTIDLWPMNTGKKLFKAKGYSDDWESLQEGAPRYIAFQFACMHPIGEVAFAKYIFSPIPLDEPLKKPSIKLAHFPDFLSKYGIDVDAGSEAILNSVVEYISTPRNTEPVEYRDDIRRGWTMCAKILVNYDEHFDRKRKVERAETDGVSIGFIAYDSQVISANKSMDLENFQAGLKKALEEEAGPENVKIIGEAQGTKHWYTDIIAWDILKVIEVAMDYFASAVVDMNVEEIEPIYKVLHQLSYPHLLVISDESLDEDPEGRR